MVNRTALSLIRAARAGNGPAQLELGRHYLSGSLGLPLSPGSALLWLLRAARQDLQEAARLVVRQIPYEVAVRDADRATLASCYRLATRAGEAQAQTLLTKLLGTDAQQTVSQSDAQEARNAADDFSHASLAALQDAAQAGERLAQLHLGMHYAHLSADGTRTPYPGFATRFTRAIALFKGAASADFPQAWLMLYYLYGLPEFAGRSQEAALHFLLQAAQAGLAQAQFLAGAHLWRTRRAHPERDVEALDWLLRASFQGHQRARAVLSKVSAHEGDMRWLEIIPAKLRTALREQQPLLAARLDLAERFSLSRPEALLIDVCAADCGHCLKVDICAHHQRSARRLIPLYSTEQRQALAALKRSFENVDVSFSGPEGNYRQRLYRLQRYTRELA